MRTWIICLWKEQRGQDMIEYALLAAAVAVTIAGYLPTTVMPTVSSIFSTINHTFSLAPS